MRRGREVRTLLPCHDPRVSFLTDPNPYVLMNAPIMEQRHRNKRSVTLP